MHLAVHESLQRSDALEKAPLMASNIAVFLFDLPRSGDANMQVDAWLLEHASKQRLPQGTYLNDQGMLVSHDALPAAPIVVRIYRWQEPTLSLGHFQSIDQLSTSWDTKDATALKKLPWVKRRTGGGAILHDCEWTYSITIPTTNQSSPTAIGHQNTIPGSKGASEILYRAVHRSIAQGLREIGADAEFSEECTCTIKKPEQSSKSDEGFLCFHRRSPLDLVIGPSKILGSAQRRGHSGLLQHGSLLLKASAAYPSIWGIKDCYPEVSLQPVGKNGKDSEAWDEWLANRIFQAILELGPASRWNSRLKPDSWQDTILDSPRVGLC